MIDLLYLIPLAFIWLICVILYLVFVAMTIKASWHAVKEWKRAFAQAFKILRHVKSSSLDQSYPWWKQIIGVVFFAFSDYGRVYQEMEVINPLTGAKVVFLYNGKADFNEQG